MLRGQENSSVIKACQLTLSNAYLSTSFKVPVLEWLNAQLWRPQNDSRPPADFCDVEIVLHKYL